MNKTAEDSLLTNFSVEQFDLYSKVVGLYRWIKGDEAEVEIRNEAFHVNGMLLETCKSLHLTVPRHSCDLSAFWNLFEIYRASLQCAEMKKRNKELEDMLRKVSDTLDANGNDYPMTNQMIKELIDLK